MQATQQVWELEQREQAIKEAEQALGHAIMAAAVYAWWCMQATQPVWELEQREQALKEAEQELGHP
jgi:hypothetical protein